MSFISKIKCFLSIHNFDYEKRNVKIDLTNSYTAKKTWYLRKCKHCKKHQRLNMPFAIISSWSNFKYGDAANFTATVINNEL